MDDLISRQEATSIPILPKEHRKTFKSVDDAFETGWNEALSCVNMLPSAQQEIIYCKECSRYSNGYCHHPDTYGMYVDANHFCGYAERMG